MVAVKREGVILEPTKLGFENKGVFNPACIKVGGNVHMFYRAWNKENKSTIGYCRLKGPLKVVERSKKPILFPDKGSEQSLEDPHITYLNGTYYLTYVTFDGKNVHIEYAVSKDLKKFKKMGKLLPEITYGEAEDLFKESGKLKERYFFFESYFKDKVGKDVLLWNKDAFLFPKKIKGKFALIHRILPDIQVIYFKDFKNLTLKYWKNYLKNLYKYVILESKHWYEMRNVGGGVPPIETDKGWLLIYHAVDDTDVGKTYRAGAALLDKNDPTKVIGQYHEPLFVPEEIWEKKGNVNNVVFPTGAAVFDKRLYIYYGAADTKVAAVSVDIDELVAELIKRGVGHYHENC